MSDKDDKKHVPQSFQNAPAVAERAVQLITQNQGQILSRWVDVAFSRIHGAQNKSRAEIADHFTKLLDGIIETLKKKDVNAVPDAPSQLGTPGYASELHGRERSSLEGYTLDQLAHEYILLRHVIVDFCAKRGLADPEVVEVISRIVEYSSLTAVSAFAKSMQEIQHKLVGTLVHDVRTPLSVAYTYAELIRYSERPGLENQQVAETITKSLKRASSMLEEVLDATRLEAGQGLFMRFAEVDINQAVETVCTEAIQVYSATIEPALEDQPIMGVFDSGLVTRTLENLISNAVKFGDQRSAIRVSVSDCGDAVQVSVHNEGEPIPEDQQHDIFSFFSSPSSRAPSAGKGWGLGLSLIKTVAKKHGGEVILESTKEQGTTIGMTLYKAYRQDGEELSTLL